MRYYVHRIAVHILLPTRRMHFNQTGNMFERMLYNCICLTIVSCSCVVCVCVIIARLFTLLKLAIAT